MYYYTLIRLTKRINYLISTYYQRFCKAKYDITKV